jgi:hypothetical protein
MIWLPDVRKKSNAKSWCQVFFVSIKMRGNNIRLQAILMALLLVPFYHANSSLAYGSASLADAKISKSHKKPISQKASQYVLPDKLCNQAYETLPQCADLGEQCQSRYSSSYLPGAPRSVIVALQDRKGFNVDEFDKFCYKICLNDPAVIRYKEFSATACRVNK